MRYRADGDRRPTLAIFIRMRTARKEYVKFMIVFRRAEEQLASASGIRHFSPAADEPGQRKKKMMNEVI